MKLKEWNENDRLERFATNHPILTYFIASSIASSVCRGAVGIVRAITGKYPPATPIYTKSYLEDEEKENEEDESETVQGTIVS